MEDPILVVDDDPRVRQLIGWTSDLNPSDEGYARWAEAMWPVIANRIP